MNNIQNLGEINNIRKKVVNQKHDTQNVASTEKIQVNETKYKQSYTLEKMQTYCQWDQTRFRIRGDADLKNLLFKAETWPKGIEITEYFFS